MLRRIIGFTASLRIINIQTVVPTAASAATAGGDGQDFVESADGRCGRRRGALWNGRGREARRRRGRSGACGAAGAADELNGGRSWAAWHHRHPLEAPVGPPGGNVGSLIVGAADGLGGRLMRTVSFLGCTLPVLFFIGSAPMGVPGIGGMSAIILS